MKVGIREVARAAGVSTATVSRALGRGPVSDALREQVAEAVRATGYRPNLSARRLRSQAAQTIGLIVADIRNPFFTAVSRAVEDAAFASGMRVILCNTDEDPAREAMYLRLMEEERVTGVIFAPTVATTATLGDEPLDYPVVLIDRAGPPGAHDSVILDNPTAGSALVDHLVAGGYRRIGGLFGSTSSTARERRAGYEAAMARHGLTPAVRAVPPNAAAAEAEIARWFAGPARPEALIASNGLILMGAVRAARALGLTIPGDLALAGFDNEPWTDLVEPGLTVIEQPVAEIGTQAMRLLFERIANPDQPIRKVVLSGRMVSRGSTLAR
ncbi:LacI family DNA-binding transcriptional regulator [Methylobacterium aerolatum]|uniref:LacI family fructose operon transcriptional repressor n=1 Tax=Methylobacterium aerolatum TaxID=418708 RepID=A0ABU0HUH3_9HYPH|nr:LacI family DNA-binding transcriptional regulator [Methylobacterium aerolatum]MDQ0445982.1 LacI family fructose operon transcriptional repressor [Methylobacterium aerolatum]GJD35020.1 HTH-type transcriptional regulator DegA [Methylobacterium aerolatum]